MSDIAGLEPELLFDHRLQEPVVLAAYVRTCATIQLRGTFPHIELTEQQLVSCMGTKRGDSARALAEVMVRAGIFKWEECENGIIELTVIGA